MTYTSLITSKMRLTNCCSHADLVRTSSRSFKLKTSLTHNSMFEIRSCGNERTFFRTFCIRISTRLLYETFSSLIELFSSWLILLLRSISKLLTSSLLLSGRFCRRFISISVAAQKTSLMERTSSRSIFT